MTSLPQSIQSVLESSMELSEKVAEISGQRSGVGRWGSCQYRSAQAMYDTLTLLSKYLTEEEIYQVFGFSVNLDKGLSYERALDRLQFRLLQGRIEQTFDDIDLGDDSGEDLMNRSSP